MSTAAGLPHGGVPRYRRGVPALIVPATRFIAACTRQKRCYHWVLCGLSIRRGRFSRVLNIRDTRDERAAVKRSVAIPQTTIRLLVIYCYKMLRRLYEGGLS